MGLINRDNNGSEQNKLYQAAVGVLGTSAIPVVTGQTYPVAIMALNGYMDSVFASAFGCSGNPILTFSLYRFIPAVGTSAYGVTYIPITGVTLTMNNFGTSGVGYAGISYINYQSTTYIVYGQTVVAGDMLVMSVGGSSTAANSINVGCTVKATDDYLKYLGH